MKNINIEQGINKWFEMKYQTYDKLEHKGSIYLYYDGEEYADVRIVKKSKYIYFNLWVWQEFSAIFLMDYSEFEEFMGKWVGYTFGLKGFKPVLRGGGWYDGLKIPKINN